MSSFDDGYATADADGDHHEAGVGGMHESTISVWTLSSRRLREIGVIELTELSNGPLTIGSESADIVLDWPGVATRHVAIERDSHDDAAERLTLEGFAAKTWVNDGPVQPGATVSLEAGDKLTIGPIELIVGRDDVRVSQPADDESPSADTAEWIERAQVQSELRRQLDAVEVAAEEQQQRLAEAEAAVEAAIEEAGRDPSGQNLEEDVDRYRGLIDELKLSLVETTGEALEAHRQRLSDLQQRQAELDELRSRVRNRSDVLSERERQLESRLDEAARLEAAVCDREAELEKLAESVSTRGRELEETEQAVWRREREIERREAEIHRHESTWQTRMAEVQSQQIDLDRMQSTTNDREAELQARIEAITERESLLREKEDAADQRAAEVEAQSSQLGEREAAIAAQLESVREERSALEADLVRLNGSRLELDERLESLEERLETLNERNSEVVRKELALDRDRERFESDRDRREEKLEQRDAELQEREIALKNRELALEMSREELDGTVSLEVTALSLPAADRGSDLEDRSAELARRSAELDDAWEQFESQRDQLRDDVAELEKSKRQLESERVELENRAAEIEQQRAEFLVERERVESTRAEVAAKIEQEEQTESRTLELEEKAAELESEAAELESARVALEAERAEIAAERSEAADMMAELASDRAAFEAERAEAEIAAEELELERQATEKLRAELAEREAAIQVEEVETVLAADEPEAGTGSDAVDSDANDAETEELERLRLDLESLRAEITQERSEIDAERGELIAERATFDRLRSEWDQQKLAAASIVEVNESETSETADTVLLEDEYAKLEAERAALAQERERLQQLEASLADQAADGLVNAEAGAPTRDDIDGSNEAAESDTTSIADDGELGFATQWVAKKSGDTDLASVQESMQLSMQAALEAIDGLEASKTKAEPEEVTAAPEVAVDNVDTEESSETLDSDATAFADPWATQDVSRVSTPTVDDDASSERSIAETETDLWSEPTVDGTSVADSSDDEAEVVTDSSSDETTAVPDTFEPQETVPLPDASSIAAAFGVSPDAFNDPFSTGDSEPSETQPVLSASEPDAFGNRDSSADFRESATNDIAEAADGDTSDVEAIEAEFGEADADVASFDEAALIEEAVEAANQALFDAEAVSAEPTSETTEPPAVDPAFDPFAPPIPPAKSESSSQGTPFSGESKSALEADDEDLTTSQLFGDLGSSLSMTGKKPDAFDPFAAPPPVPEPPSSFDSDDSVGDANSTELEATNETRDSESSFADPFGAFGATQENPSDLFTDSTPTATELPAADVSTSDVNPTADSLFASEPPAAASENMTDSQLGIRSQLADMFGVSMTQLAEAAGRSETEDPDALLNENKAELTGDADAAADSVSSSADDVWSNAAATATESEVDSLGNALDSVEFAEPEATPEVDQSTPDDDIFAQAHAEEQKAHDAGSNGDGMPSFDANTFESPGLGASETQSGPLGQQFDLPLTGVEGSDLATETKEEATTNDGQGDDSVAAYMERLLARSRGDSEPASAVPSADPEPAAPAARAPEPAVEPKERQPVDADKIRKEVVSFREVALMSSRSAVASSRIKQVRMQLMAKICATGIGFVVSGVLLASPAWSRENYVVLGVIALLISAGIAYFTWESMRHYKRMVEVTRVAKSSEGDAS